MMRLLMGSVLLVAGIGLNTNADATILFQVNAESGYVDGDTVGNPPMCNSQCGEAVVGKPIAKSFANCSPAAHAPTGNYCFKWDIVANQSQYRSEMRPILNYTVTEGEVLYMGYQLKLERIGGADIFHDGGNTGQNQQSGDKGIEMIAIDSSDFRWVISEGQWDSMCWNTDHKWSIWLGNPTNHFNPTIEFVSAIRPNAGGYGVSCGGSLTDGPQLDYDRWYNIVGVFKMSDDSPKDGYVKIYVNGTLIIDYTGIQVTNTNTGANIGLCCTEIGGTIAQAAYDAPAHTRYHDEFIIATSAADVAFLMVDPEVSGSKVGASGSTRFTGAVRIE